MKIYLTRHGQTDLNLKKRMQGRIDEPLNETGKQQAGAAREQVKNIQFDAVYASPLCRAVETASIISGFPEEKIRIDPRIIEVDFGKYENCPYGRIGFGLGMFWLLPEVFPAPETVESIASMVERSRSFLKDLEQKDYENVLVVCHGGIIRALCGCMEQRPKGILWRPKPKNCEIRVYEADHGTFTRIR